MSSRVGLVANVGPRLASAAGISIEDFIIDCRFMNDVCNLTQLFTKTFDSYYFNCFTFQPQMILKSRATRLSGVEYGLSLMLFLGLFVLLPADTHAIAVRLSISHLVSSY